MFINFIYIFIYTEPEKVRYISITGKNVGNYFIIAIFFGFAIHY